jgi:hypothetical protein
VVIAAGDASASGVGVTMIQCPAGLLHKLASTSLTTAEQSRGSVLREMIMILFYVRTYRDTNAGARAIVCTDATGARAAVRYGSRFPDIHRLALDIDAIVRADDTDLQVLHWPRDGIGATAADDMSRVPDSDVCDFHLPLGAYLTICHFINRGVPAYDLYADTHNRKATLFFSRTFMPETLGVNAPDQLIPVGSYAYACPPPRGLAIAEFLRSTFADCTYLLIIPAWFNTPHYPLLFSSSHTPRPGVHVFPALAASIFRRGPIGKPSYIEGPSTHYTRFWVLILTRYGVRARPVESPRTRRRNSRTGPSAGQN